MNTTRSRDIPIVGGRIVGIYCALALSNVGLYLELLKGSGHELLLRDSYYVHAFGQGEQANLDSLDYKLRRAKGAELEKINRQDLLELAPALSGQFQAAILIKGQARTLSPGKIGQVLVLRKLKDKEQIQVA